MSTSDQPITSYAQNREDIILQAYFHDVKDGVYVDIGANHPVIDSVTNLFYEKGWSGINVEPLPNMFAELVRLRPRDINVNCLVGKKAGTSVLHIYHTAGGFDGLSTASENQEKVNDTIKRDDILAKEDIEVEVKTLEDIFRLLPNKNKTIHFLKVDVEGLEFEVLSSNNWKKFRPEIICVEADHVFENWQKYLIKKGYRLDFFDGINEYYVEKNSHRKLTDVYVDHILKKTHVSLYARMHFQQQSLDQEHAHKFEIDRIVEREKMLSARTRQLEEKVKVLNEKLNRHENLPKYIISTLVDLSEKLEQRIQGLNRPRWNYPNLNDAVEDSSFEDLIKVASEADKVFATKAKVPLFKKVVYKVLILIFRIVRKVVRVIYRVLLKAYKSLRKR